MTTVLKRRSEDRGIEALPMANCLMLLSRVGDKTRTEGGRVFPCKTCDRKFSSFQALGGHRANHKKSRLGVDDLCGRSLAAKPSRAHRCPICGQEFSIGQALGGHMRRHRAVTGQEITVGTTSSDNKSEELMAIVTPVLKRSSSCSKRVVCLDLNLTPFENKMKLGIIATLPSWLILDSLT